DAGIRVNVGDDRRRNEPAFAGQLMSPAPGDDAAFLFADFDVLVDFLVSPFARNRAGEIIHVFDWSDGKFAYALGDFCHHLIVNRRDYYGAGAGRAFLARIPEGRSDDAGGGIVEVRRFVNDYGVFAAHFGDDAFDPDLAFALFSGQFVDSQPNGHRTSECDEARLRVFDQ